MQAHLFEVYKILKIWGADDVIAKCGLMHSAYSNSYVNLAIFKPDVERTRVATLVGPECEKLIHTFCVVSGPAARHLSNMTAVHSVCAVQKPLYCVKCLSMQHTVNKTAW